MSLIRQSLRALKTARTPVIARATFATSTPESNSDDIEVVIPEEHMSLEWVLSSPPPLHQFDEPPIVVETWGPVDPTHH